MASVIVLLVLVVLAARGSDVWEIVSVSVFGATLLLLYLASTLYLRGAWGWSLFGLIWGLAVAGITFKLLFTGRFRLASTLIYVGMVGWGSSPPVH